MRPESGRGLDVRAVGDTLLLLTGGGDVYESVDEGNTWLFAGPLENQTVDPWALTDGLGQRHTLGIDGLTDEYVWQWFAPGAGEPLATRRLPIPTRSPRCRTGAGIVLEDGREIGATLVTRGGELIRCKGGGGPLISYLIASPEDEAWREVHVGLSGAQNIDGSLARANPWAFQVVELTDGRVLFGFTGLDPRTQRSRAMLVELRADGTLSAPHVLRPGGGYAQQFRSMEPLPGGGVLVVWRDHGLPDIGAGPGGGHELFARVDVLSPDEALLEAWKEMGVTR